MNINSPAAYRIEAEKRYRNLQFRDDFLFCKILESNPDIAKELIEMILNVRIKHVIVQKQTSIEIVSEARGVRLDVYAEDENDTIYDIEMQTTKKNNLPKRSRYYQGMIDLNLIDRGDDFNKLRKTYIIFICMRDPFAEGRYIYSFENTCRENKSLLLGDEITKVFLNANGTKEKISDDLMDFFELLRNGHGKSVLSKKIEHQVRNAKNHIEWRREYMTLFLRDIDKKEEGRAEGVMETVFSLVQEGDLSPEKGAKKMNISVDELFEEMEKAGYKVPQIS